MALVFIIIKMENNIKENGQMVNFIYFFITLNKIYDKGKHHGQGIFKFINGSYYDGEFYNSRKI